MILSTRIHLNSAAILSYKPAPPQSSSASSACRRSATIPWTCCSKTSTLGCTTTTLNGLTAVPKPGTKARIEVIHEIIRQEG